MSFGYSFEFVVKGNATDARFIAVARTILTKKSENNEGTKIARDAADVVVHLRQSKPDGGAIASAVNEWRDRTGSAIISETSGFSPGGFVPCTRERTGAMPAFQRCRKWLVAIVFLCTSGGAFQQSVAARALRPEPSPGRAIASTGLESLDESEEQATNDPSAESNGPGILSGKEPVPNADAIKAADKTLREIFGKDIDKAKSPAAKGELAKKLLKSATETRNDSPTAYALMQIARELAIEAGEVGAALGSVEQFVSTFQLNSVAMQEETLAALVKRAKFATQRKAIAEAALELAEDHVAQDDFVTADRFGKLALSAAGGAGDPVLLKRSAARVKEFDDLQKMFQDVQRDYELLKKRPNDPAANFKVGEYECFVKGEWDLGLPRLAKGKPGPLKEVAVKELAAPAAPSEQAALADAWSSLAEKEKGAAKSAIEQHADDWYQKALPGLSGLTRTAVEKKLAAKTKKIKPTDSRTPRALKPGLVGEYFADPLFKKRVFVRQDGNIDFDWGTNSPGIGVPADDFGVRWHGYLKAPKPGKYTFILICDNGTRMYLDGKVIINQLGTGGQHQLTAEVELTSKAHEIRIDYNEGILTAWCRLRWLRAEAGGFSEQAIGPQFLFHLRDQEKVNTEGQ